MRTAVLDQGAASLTMLCPNPYLLQPCPYCAAAILSHYVSGSRYAPPGSGLRAERRGREIDEPLCGETRAAVLLSRLGWSLLHAPFMRVYGERKAGTLASTS